MSKEKKFLTIGVWVAILPFLGFPNTFKNILFVLTGFLIIYMSYGMYLESKKEKKEEKTLDNFSENKDFTKAEQPS
jgi:hypothetical protein